MSDIKIEEMGEKTEKTEDTEEKIKYPLNTIYFYLTKGCNLACRHCWVAPKHQADDKKYPELKFEHFVSVIEQAKPLGLTGVKLTGGEPLMHSRIKDILEYVKKEELRLTVETNGVLCTAELAKLMRECKNPFVSVSLDGVDADTHEWVRGVKGCFDEAVKGINNLVDAGFRPQIIFTIMRRNKHQIEDIVRLAEKLKAGSVKFNIMQPSGRGKGMHEADEDLGIEELVELGEWIERVLSEITNTKIYHSHPIAFRPLSKLFGNNGDGCRICGIFNILGVLSDSSYALCGIGESVPELVFGNISKVFLKDVWDNNIIINKIRNSLPEKLEGVCNNCLMKNICLGSCLAQNYYNHKNLWGSYWYCTYAEEKGLFNKNRCCL